MVPTGFRPPFWLETVLRRVHGWVERSRQRRQLSRLSDHALKDIGLTRADVQGEIEKPFWHP